MPETNTTTINYMGLMSMAEMMREQTLALEKDDPYEHEEVIVRKLSEMVEIHPAYAQDMACFYENAGFADELVEHCYARAIDADDGVGAVLNAADFYKKRGRRDRMITHLLDIIGRGKGYRSLASLLLSLHYAKLNNEDTTKMYYDMAVTYADLDDMDVLIESHELIKLLDFVGDGGWHQGSSVHKALQALAATRPGVTIFRTKKALFTRLNHLGECGVCFDFGLHLDFQCGHCVCEACYLKLMYLPCPFCRHSSH